MPQASDCATGIRCQSKQPTVPQASDPQSRQPAVPQVGSCATGSLTPFKGPKNAPLGASGATPMSWALWGHMWAHGGAAGVREAQFTFVLPQRGIAILCVCGCGQGPKTFPEPPGARRPPPAARRHTPCLCVAQPHRPVWLSHIGLCGSATLSHTSLSGSGTHACVAHAHRPVWLSHRSLMRPHDA